MPLRGREANNLLLLPKRDNKRRRWPPFPTFLTILSRRYETQRIKMNACIVNAVIPFHIPFVTDKPAGGKQVICYRASQYTNKSIQTSISSQCTFCSFPPIHATCPHLCTPQVPPKSAAYARNLSSQRKRNRCQSLD